MSKWSSITFNDGVVPTTETSKGIQWNIAAWLLVAIAVTVFFATTRSRPVVVQRQSEAPVAMVVNAKAEPEVSADPEPDAVVSAKKAPESRLWATTEASSIEQPSLETEGGLGFADFHRAFSESREKRVSETSKKHFASGDMKAYAELHDVPDAFLDAVASTEKQSERSVKKIDGPEAMMLAREALQSIQGTSDAASSIMRDVLAARTEAARAGIELPEVPEEQKAQLLMWASRSGPASVLAKTILSR